MMRAADPRALYASQHPEVAARVYDGEAIIVLPTKGEVLVLNGVGSRIWELLDGQRSVEEIAASIVAEYETSLDQAREDVVSFLGVLEARGAVTLKGGSQ